jgi:Na+-transporting methylmalonyl-CoA/oxaloacetate decarboxylase gamma subunit
MEFILAIILQVLTTALFLNVIRTYVQQGSFKKMLHVCGVLNSLNSYAVQTIFFVSISEMRKAAMFNASDPFFKLGNELVTYGLAVGQFGGLLGSLMALELLPLVIDVFQQQQRQMRIKQLKWFTFLFFLIAMVITIGMNALPNALTVPIRLTISYLLILWPSYSLTLQMTVLTILLRHLMKQYENYVRQSPEVSKNLLKSLKIMIFLNVVAMAMVGLGYMNFLFDMISIIPAQWNILLIMLGFTVFFIMLTLLTFFIFNVKHVVSRKEMNTNEPTIATHILKPFPQK